VTSISKDFIECNLRSPDVVDALKLGNQTVIDQVASKIYSKMLNVGNVGLQDAPNWPQKDEKLKWVLHTQVTVFGDILNIEDLLEQVKHGNYEDRESIVNLAYELKFFLLNLLALYYDLNYSTWNLIDLFIPDVLSEEQLLTLVKPAVQSPSYSDLITAHANNPTRAVLKQALTNWRYWGDVYKTLMMRTYDANNDDTIVAFHSVLAVSAHLISASHLGSLILFRAKSRLVD
jgi:hypothetical protein